MRSVYKFSIGSARSGNLSVFERFFSEAKQSIHVNSIALTNAVESKGKDKLIIIDMILATYTGLTRLEYFDLDYALQSACKVGDKKLIELFLAKGATWIDGAFEGLVSVFSFSISNVSL